MNEEKKFKIEDLDIKTRKLIFKISIFILTILVFASWFSFFTANLKDIPQEESKKVSELKQHVSEIGEALESGKEVIDEIKEQFNTIKELSNSSTTPTTTPTQISDEEIEKIKEIILEQTFISPTSSLDENIE